MIYCEVTGARVAGIYYPTQKAVSTVRRQGSRAT